MFGFILCFLEALLASQADLHICSALNQLDGLVCQRGKQVTGPAQGCHFQSWTQNLLLLAEEEPCAFSVQRPLKSRVLFREAVTWLAFFAKHFSGCFKSPSPKIAGYSVEEYSLSSLVPNKKSSFIKDQSRRHKCEIEIDTTYSLLAVAASSRSCNGGQEFELGRPTFKYGAHAVGTCGATKTKNSPSSSM